MEPDAQRPYAEAFFLRYRSSAGPCLPAGSEILPAGSETLPAGSEALPAGSEAHPAGSMALPAGSEALPAGSEAPGSRRIPTLILLNVLNVLNTPKDASLACWGLLLFLDNFCILEVFNLYFRSVAASWSLGRD